MKGLAISARIFVSGAVLSYRALFRWLSPPSYMASKIIMPLNQILFFSLLGTFATGPDNTSFYVIGNSMQVAALSGVYGVTMSISGERWEGTLIYLFGAPANRLLVFGGRAFMHLIDGMVGVALGLTWGVLLLGLDLSHANFGGLILTIVITTASTSAFGLLFGSFSLITRNVMFINNTVYFLLLVFSGANVPLADFPTWIRGFSYSLPLTRGIAAARQVIAGASLAEVIPLLIGEMLVGLGYFFVGYLIFRWFEVQAKRRGTLEAF